MSVLVGPYWLLSATLAVILAVIFFTRFSDVFPALLSSRRVYSSRKGSALMFGIFVAVLGCAGLVWNMVPLSQSLPNWHNKQPALPMHQLPLTRSLAPYFHTGPLLLKREVSELRRRLGMEIADKVC